MMKRALLPGFIVSVFLLAGVFMSGATAHANSFADCTSSASVCTDGTSCYTVPGTTAKRCLLQTQYDVLQANQGTPVGTGNTDTGTAVGTGNTTGTGATTIANPLKVDSLDALLNLVLGAVVQLGSIILTIALIWCGFLFVAARGNEEKIRNARTALMWTVIGGLILLGATGIKTVLTSTVSGITS